MFSWYKYLIVNFVFSHLGFWSGNLFLIAPFPDLCLLVSFLLLKIQRFFLRGGFKRFEEKCCQICNCHGNFTLSMHVVNEHITCI